MEIRSKRFVFCEYYQRKLIDCLQEALGIVDDVLEELRSVRTVRPLFAAELKHDREHRLNDGKYRLSMDLIFQLTCMT
jgi:hypothetical protein